MTMTMKMSDSILGKPRGSYADVAGWCGSRGRPMDTFLYEYLAEVFRLAPLLGIDSAIAISQSCHECLNPDTGKPWDSFWYRSRGNVAGIGITGDPAQNAASHTWTNGTDAARSQLGHLLVYALGPSDAGSLWHRKAAGVDQPLSVIDPRYEAYVDAYGNVARAQTIADLAGTWAADRDYATGITAKAAAIFPNLPSQEAPSVTEFSTTIPGLPGGPLVTTYPIRFNLIAVDGFQRTGRKAHTPRRSITHGTGNPSNASAMAEAQYFVSGAEGRQASIHACIDDHEVVVCMPLDEIAFQAADGAGPGNTNGFACETMEATAIWNDWGRRDRLIAIAADFQGRCSARLDIHRAERHWDFNWGECCDSPCDVQCGNRHHCPDKLMDTGLWETAYVPQWNAARIDELRRMGGQTPATTTTARPIPAYAKPHPPKLDSRGQPYAHIDDGGNVWLPLAKRRWTALRQTARREWADPNADEVGTPVAQGETVNFLYAVANDRGECFLTSKSGTRCLAIDFIR